jgi:ABC-type multidrug transport system permease subunit
LAVSGAFSSRVVFILFTKLQQSVVLQHVIRQPVVQQLIAQHPVVLQLVLQRHVVQQRTICSTTTRSCVSLIFNIIVITPGYFISSRSSTSCSCYSCNVCYTQFRSANLLPEASNLLSRKSLASLSYSISSLEFTSMLISPPLSL